MLHVEYGILGAHEALAIEVLEGILGVARALELDKAEA